MKYRIVLIMAMAIISNAKAQSVDGENSMEQRLQSLENMLKPFKQMKVSGYIQPQFQYGEPAANLKVGSSNENLEHSFSRIGIRRGRIKMINNHGIATYLFQLDFNEKGVNIRDLYLNITDPWMKSTTFRAGLFYRPFGIEISYSSSVRESPERALIIQTLFPDERDLGGMIVLQAPKKTKWSIFKLEAGLFAGNGIKPEIDSKRDFIGHLSVTKDFSRWLNFGAGVSYYNGKVYQGTETVYAMDGARFVANTDPSNKGNFAKREYKGVDAFFKLSTFLGTSSLRAEYIVGQQPGLLKSSKSPNSASLPTEDTYIRDFEGGYLQAAHQLFSSPLTLVAKYEWHDPNTLVKGNEIGLNGTGSTDLAQKVLGLGIVLQVDKNVRLQTYYEFNRNETSSQLKNYESDIKNDVLTVRLQYKF